MVPHTKCRVHQVLAKIIVVICAVVRAKHHKFHIWSTKWYFEHSATAKNGQRQRRRRLRMISMLSRSSVFRTTSQRHSLAKMMPEGIAPFNAYGLCVWVFRVYAFLIYRVPLNSKSLLVSGKTWWGQDLGIGCVSRSCFHYVWWWIFQCIKPQSLQTITLSLFCLYWFAESICVYWIHLFRLKLHCFGWLKCTHFSCV